MTGGQKGGGGLFKGPLIEGALKDFREGGERKAEKETSLGQSSTPRR